MSNFSKRNFRRAVIKAHHRNGGADVCHGCHRPLESLELTTIGQDQGGQLLVVGQCCTRRLTGALGYGLYVARDEDPERVTTAAQIAHLGMTEPAGSA